MKLHFEERGEGAPVLLLHGFTGCAADWLPLLPMLPPDRRFIIPDLRGHGKSPNPEDVYLHRQAALDVWKLLDSLGIEKLSACGVSGGAMALLHMAIQLPARLESIVLVSATTHYPPTARQIMGLTTADDQTDEAWAAMREKHPGGDEQIRKLWRQANAFKDDSFDMALTSSDLETIEADTLIVHGDRDPLFPIDIPVSMYEAIPRSSLWIVPGGEHVPVFGSSMTHFFELASEHLTAGSPAAS